MSVIRVGVLSVLTMFAFAGNSILCRVALEHTSIDEASFTSIRLISGALVLLLIANVLKKNNSGNGSWISALVLFLYAAGFSFAYNSLSAATGALLLFGAVQLTMISYGLWTGERLTKQQLLGLAMALLGFVVLFIPGISAPPLAGAILMLIAGVAWGVYSIQGKKSGDPTHTTAGNFLRASVLAIVMSIFMIGENHLDSQGVVYAILSGALASGVGYAIWYSVLPHLQSITAAMLQLSVPIIAAVGGIVMLNESITIRFVLASITILGGIMLVIICKKETN